MTLEIVRRIRDNLHGSIDISELENAVLSHPYVQRLRRIKQLAFLSYVFPGATHTRFEHSLGVMHLAGVAWSKLRTNQERLYQALCRYDNFEEMESQKFQNVLRHGRLVPTFGLLEKVFHSDYVLQVIRLAGLLHDLGHPPFSHSGERFLPSLDKILQENSTLPSYLKEFLIDLQKKNDETKKNRAVRHEIFSILMIEKVLRETYEKFPDLKIKVDARDVISAVSGKILPSPESKLHHHHAFTLCRELISGELDIDRMDYLLRDSRECGVVYGVFDVERILDSLCVYFDDEKKDLHVAINLSGLAAFEDYLRARLSMYLQLYFHKSSVGAEAMMQHLARSLKGWRLPASLEDYARCDEWNIGERLKQEAALKLKDQDLKDFTEKVDDLLFHRQLWKRIYEISGPKAQISLKNLEKVEKYLVDQGIKIERVSSGSSLTQFRPRRQHEKSANNLRLVKKDESQFPRVIPIEDYSEVIRSNTDVVIHRLYVEGKIDEKGQYLPDRVRQLVSNFQKK